MHVLGHYDSKINVHDLKNLSGWIKIGIFSFGIFAWRLKFLAFTFLLQQHPELSRLEVLFFVPVPPPPKKFRPLSDPEKNRCPNSVWSITEDFGALVLIKWLSTWKAELSAAAALERNRWKGHSVKSWPFSFSDGRWARTKKGRHRKLNKVVPTSLWQRQRQPHDYKWLLIRLITTFKTVQNEKQLFCNESKLCPVRYSIAAENWNC